MAVDHVKSTPITNLDASPIVENTSGEGGIGVLRNLTGSAVALLNSSADATYQLVRVPSNAKIKAVRFESAAQGAGKFDLGVYYATDGGPGGHPTALLAADALDQDLFAAVIDCASAVAITDETNQSGTYTIDKRIQPLWQVLGLSADPLCNFDIVATVKTTAVTTGTGRLGVSVDFVI